LFHLKKHKEKVNAIEEEGRKEGESGREKITEMKLPKTVLMQ